MTRYLFPIGYWTVSILFGLISIPLLLWPNRKPMAVMLRVYARTMVWLLDTLCGIDFSFRGKENLPKGPFIVAAKHQSWGDGFLQLSQIPDLGFVTNDGLLRYPLLGAIFRKLGAIVIDSAGGQVSRSKITGPELTAARAENRPFLIYPEGRLVAIGETERYRRGIYHMYRSYNCPVVPAATDFGTRYPQRALFPRPGPATLEYLEPIPPGLDKETFMARLEAAIENRSLELLEDQEAAGTLPEGISLPPRQELLQAA
ncbi:lysophospholipid acyltransferase family protein [Aestuariibius sp. 2305UL40-4]|uniref:lysophospholipid acyltransferase family protein n=1 Tax=Aestuariibius violaceus TaxID=3234132 RepID=UPI00345E1091